MWQGWINLVLGVWLIISGLVSSLQTPANLIITGILVAVFGFWTYKDWLGDIIGVLGLWSLLSGIWFSLFSPANFLIVGVLIGGLGFWEAYLHSKPITPHTS
jgi:hypothetical protein